MPMVATTVPTFSLEFDLGSILGDQFERNPLLKAAFFKAFNALDMNFDHMLMFEKINAVARQEDCSLEDAYHMIENARLADLQFKVNGNEASIHLLKEYDTIMQVDNNCNVGSAIPSAYSLVYRIPEQLD